MTILEIENDIIAQLQSNITDLQVEGFPESPVEYKLLHSKGAVLVHFKGGSYSAPESNMFIQQEVNMDFSITLMIRGLRDKNGAYPYIDAINKALTGFAPKDCLRMYPVGEYFLTERDGVWHYTINFRVPTDNYA